MAYLAERRNAAVRGALELYPNSDHILMIDSYYLRQANQIATLLEEYDHCEGILGASTWIVDKTRVIPRIRFFDSWTTPEAANLKLASVGREHNSRSVPGDPRTSWLRVGAVGACYVYPRRIWEKYQYGVPDTDGCEHNFLCQHSGAPVWLSLNSKLWHEPSVYSWPKRIRCSLHLGRFLN